MCMSVTHTGCRAHHPKVRAQEATGLAAFVDLLGGNEQLQDLLMVKVTKLIPLNVSVIWS